MTIEDEPAADLVVAALSLEVEDDHRLAGVFRIRLSIHRGDDGLWVFLDDDRLKLWNKVRISVSIGDDEQELIQAYVTGVNAHFDSEENDSFLDVTGMDATCLMSLEEKIQDWPNKKDSDIAQQIFATYNLTPEIDDTEVTHDEAVSTIIQRDTDIQFLRRLARRNGFECVVRGDTGFFRKPVLTDAPQPVLAAHFGPDTTLSHFDARINAMRPTRVEMHQIDSISKEVVDTTAAKGEQKQLGRDAALSLSPPNGVQATMFVRQAVATAQPEMQNLCRAVFDEAEWLIEASGEIDSATYGSVLRASKLVPVKGVGEMFSGVYYVTNVKHVFTVERYIQEFKVRRNAIAPASGDFDEGGGLLPF